MDDAIGFAGGLVGLVIMILGLMLLVLAILTPVFVYLIQQDIKRLKLRSEELAYLQKKQVAELEKVHQQLNGLLQVGQWMVDSWPGRSK